jgi:hypothetical protein
MIAGDTLTAHYVAAPEGAAGAPPWLLVIDRPGSGTSSARAAGRRPDPNAGMPRAFALFQNLPNPFAASTTIRFALPVASRVRLEVYDLLGRRVRTLANALYPPGAHGQRRARLPRALLLPDGGRPVSGEEAHGDSAVTG